ncbi:uncharacterized protein LOC134769349 [Penaeus indicus]|uniref:uncharacterized protein LOC134769349 n=1 Tax=Penaeus indicus TaxID=29960 RepID=UPI00300D3D96
MAGVENKGCHNETYCAQRHKQQEGGYVSKPEIVLGKISMSGREEISQGDPKMQESRKSDAEEERHKSDLRNNQLLVLSWRSLWPHAIPGQGLRSINASGNPLLAYHCGNLWLLKWQQKTIRGIEKEGHREEGRGEGGREEVEEGEMREEDRYTSVGRQGGQKTRIETEAKNAWEEDERDGKEGTGKIRTRRRREKREGWTQDTRETSQVLTTEDCPSPGSSYSGCYLCAASLMIVNDTGSGPCRHFILTCSVSGEPKPHIEWDIPPHLILLHHDIDNLSASHITSTARFVLNMTEIVRARHLSPLACVASNEMYVSVEKINIDVDLHLPRSPVVCLAEYINSSPTILYFETQAAAPFNVTWWFYPCFGIHPREVKMPLYTHPMSPGSSSLLQVPRHAPYRPLRDPPQQRVRQQHQEEVHQQPAPDFPLLPGYGSRRHSRRGADPTPRLPDAPYH